MSKKKRRDLRILWNSNSPWSNSGYGIELRDIIRRLRDDGWAQAVSCFFGLQSYPIEWEGIKCYPAMADTWGSDAMVFHAKDFKANVVFSLQDIWTLNPQYLQKIKTWIPWMPIDKDPAPPNVLEKLRYAYKILTLCGFGQKMLENAGFSSTKMYEGTDLDIFKPLDKEECRKELNLPQDAFVFGMVGANKENPPRKGYQEAMEAFKIFHDKHPEACMFFHTQQKAPSQFPINAFAKHLGIDKKIFLMTDYQATFKSSSDVICKEYNAFDVLLHPSQTEGFGLCIIEAQATGTPVIVQKCQSMPELVKDGKTGWIAETAFKRFTNDGSFANVASVESVYECMEKAYKALKSKPEKIARNCRKHIMDNFNIDTLVKQNWIPFLEELQDDLLN